MRVTPASPHRAISSRSRRHPKRVTSMAEGSRPRSRQASSIRRRPSATISGVDQR